MNRRVLNLGLFALCILGLVLSSVSGTANLTLGETLAAAADPQSRIFAIIWELRMPRATAALFTGAALGASGAALQGLLRNPLAGPGVLGISAVASLGAVITIYFGWVAAIGAWALPVGAMLGAFGAIAILVLAMGPKTNPVTVILVGLGFSSLAGAMLSLVINLANSPFQLSDMINWLLGSVAFRSWNDLILVALPAVIGAFALSQSGAGLRALSLGEDVAKTLGASPQRTQLWVILGSGALVGSSVALAGTIGFVGIVAPHILRPLVRSDPASLILPSALLGGALLVFTDLLIRTVPLLQGINLGVAVALIGAPIFIWIAARVSKGWAV